MTAARVVPVVAYMPEARMMHSPLSLKRIIDEMEQVYGAAHPQKWSFEHVAWGRLLWNLAEALKSGRVEIATSTESITMVAGLLAHLADMGDR